jgi:anti-anti-sigma factor
MTMNIRIAQEHGRVPVTVFYVQGQLNLGSADQLEQAARAAYDHGMRNLLLDLSETTSLTSAGLRAVHALYQLLGEPGAGGAAPKSAHLKLLNPPPALRRVLEIAGFDSFIAILDNLPAAIQSFGP